MRKLIIPFIGIVFLLASCVKKDARAPAPDQASETTAITRQCASNEVLQRQIAENPERGKYLEELERKTQVYRGRQENARLAGTLYVPVVVHIVHTNANI